LRIEYHFHPVEGMKSAIDHLVTGRCLHPGIGSEDPERGKQRPDGHHDGGEAIGPRRNKLAAEQRMPRKLASRKNAVRPS
jgi:hypothetical protein